MIFHLSSGPYPNSKEGWRSGILEESEAIKIDTVQSEILF